MPGQMITSDIPYSFYHQYCPSARTRSMPSVGPPRGSGFSFFGEYDNDELHDGHFYVGDGAKRTVINPRLAPERGGSSTDRNGNVISSDGTGRYYIR